MEPTVPAHARDVKPGSRTASRLPTPGPGSEPSRHLGADCCDHVGVILEHALLSVRAGEQDAFEAAFREARTIIASMPGFLGLTLSRSVHQPASYLLLVRWRRLEDHTLGFRRSAQYRDWSRLLHHFYEPFPTVDHFEPLPDAPDDSVDG